MRRPHWPRADVAATAARAATCPWAAGSAGGIRTALALCRPMGTIVLKSTVSAVTGGRPGQQDAAQAAEAGTGTGAGAGAAAAHPCWAELANDIVVNEKVLLGSRCGSRLTPRDAGRTGPMGQRFSCSNSHVLVGWHALVNAFGPLEAP